MKKLITLLFICCLSSAQAQHKETRKLGNHDAISVTTGLVVEYINSSKNEAVISCENKEHINLIITEIKNGVLEIRYKSNSKVSTQKANTVTIYSNANLKKAKASSSGKLIIKDAINVSTFELSASSSGNIITNNIKADLVKINSSSSAKIETNILAKTLKIDASSSSKINVSGSAADVSVDMSSSANVELTKTNIGTLDVEGNSSATLLIKTASSLNCELSSSAKVLYNDAPSNIIKNKISSGGKLMKK